MLRARIDRFRPVAGAIACVALLAEVSAAAGAAQADISGVWEMTLDTQAGEWIWTVTFEQDGTTVEGEIDMNDGEEPLPLTGSIESSTIRWRFLVPDMDGPMPFNLSGEVEGATMKGEGSWAWFGAGVWTAAKQ